MCVCKIECQYDCWKKKKKKDRGRWKDIYTQGGWGIPKLEREGNNRRDELQIVNRDGRLGKEGGCSWFLYGVFREPIQDFPNIFVKRGGRAAQAGVVERAPARWKLTEF